jgi:hypothetical protein
MSPSIFLAFILASLYGFVFYLIFGHGWLRLAFYWVVSVAGFFIGQWVANLVGLAIFNVGEMNLVEGTLVCWLCLFAAKTWRGR